MPFLIRPRFSDLRFLYNDGPPPMPTLEEMQEYEVSLIWADLGAQLERASLNELILESLSERFETILGEYKDLLRVEKQCAAMA